MNRPKGPLVDGAVMIVWVAILLWLFNATHYRDELRAHVSGKPGIIDGLRYSPQLLHGGIYRAALFVWIWAPLVVLAALIGRSVFGKRKAN